MKALRDFFSNWMLVIIFLAWIFMNYWMFFGQGGFSDIMKISDGKLIPDLCLYQTNDNLMETLSAWGAEGRLNYKRYQFRDFIYPMVYAALLFGMMIRLIRPKSINVWLFLPILAMIFDFMENVLLRLLVYDFPHLDSIRVFFASLTTSLKWIFIVASLSIIVLSYIKRRKKYILKEEKKALADAEAESMML